MDKILKAVIPVAGLGTRLLPATKALPKEMLPIIDKPAIQYVVEEAVASGLAHILMVTGRNKIALENHFDRAVELENVLTNKGDLARLEQVELASELADIHFVRQGNPLGLGHAVSKAQVFVGEEPFALLLGDDLIEAGSQLLPDMMALALERGANVVAFMEVNLEEISSFGVAEVGTFESENVFNVTALVEKPTPQQAPSRLAVIGRYVLQPGVFDVLRNLKPGVGKEIQLTDALSLMAQDPTLAGPVLGVVFRGRRFDTGDRLSLLKTSVQFAAERDDLGGDFNQWLKDFAAQL